VDNVIYSVMDKNTKIGIAIGTMLAFFTGNFMITNADSLSRQLQYGMSGSDVGTLQSFLARDPSIYTGPVTNYFGSLTRAAVMKFQQMNNLAQVGRVGPQTMALINQRMGNGTSTMPAPIKMIYNVSTSTANGVTTLNWTTLNSSRGVVYYSMYPMNMYENENSVSIQGSTATDNNQGTTHSVQIPNLTPNTTYYYTIYTTDANGNVHMTWPGILLWGTNTYYTNPAQGATTTTPTTGTSTSTTTIPNVSATTSTSTGM